jgi:ribA/ribD-fused uncharacterized protein
MEQFIMALKARMFGDMKSEKLIMEATNPKVIKKLGRQVVNFDKFKWEMTAPQAVYYALLQKFSQDRSYRHELYRSQQANIIESSPFDLFWGAGMSKSAITRTDPSVLPGRNIMGKLLEKVRDQFG